jgi:uncharacterized protein
MKFGLRDTDIQFIQALFAEEPAIEQAWVFGSRAKGNHQAGSDVDIALIGTELTRQTVAHIHSVLEEESPIPFFFDVVHWNKMSNEKVKIEIQRTAQPLYQRPS